MTPLRFLPIFQLCLVLTLVGTAPLLAAKEAVDPVATKKELQQVKKRIDQLQQQIKTTQTQRTAAENDLRQAEKEISATRRKLRDVQNSQADANAKLAQLEQAQVQLKQARDRQKNAMKNDIGAAYRAGRQEYIKLLLNQEDPDKLSRLMKYYEYFRDARLQRINAFNQTLTDIDDNETRIHQRVTELEQLKTSLDEEQERLDKARQRRHSLLAKLDSSLKNRNTQVGQLKSSQSDLEKVLQAVQASMSDLPRNLGKQPISKLQGKLRWPSAGKLLHRFGAYRENGALRWNGVLIGANAGSPVKAVHHGRVVFSDWMRGFGNLIIIDHGDGYLSLYGHNESLLKGPGDWVNNGETIALSGNTGGQNQAGLYFEMRHDGKPINPARWCKG